jgi:tetratricopeptide (TPR) repeat protein
MQSKMRARKLLLGISLLAMATCWAQTSPAPNAATDRQRQAALTLEQQGDNAGSEAAWRSILKAHPANAEAYAHLGLLEARQEHYKEAVPLYRKALALGPKLPGVQLNLGLALFKSGDLKSSIEVFGPLAKSFPAASPQAVQVNTLLGMAHYGLGEYAAAVPYLKASAAADAQNLPLRLALAHSCLWSKQNQCVLDVYREILTLNANSAEADLLAGEALDDMKDHAGAILQFRAAVEASPKEPDVHFGLGYLLWTQRQYPEAVTEFQAELANNPLHAQALTYMADAQMQLNHPELSPPLLEKAIGIDPKLELAHLDLGVLYADAGRKDDALREMQSAVRLAPDDVNAHWRLGRLYRSMGKMEEAKAEMAKATNINRAADEDLAHKMGRGNAQPAPTPESTGK